MELDSSGVYTARTAGLSLSFQVGVSVSLFVLSKQSLGSFQWSRWNSYMMAVGSLESSSGLFKA